MAKQTLALIVTEADRGPAGLVANYNANLGRVNDNFDELYTSTGTGSTGATQMAVGTTAQRPAAPTAGMIRFNTTIPQFEGWDGSAWIPLAIGA